MAGQSVDLKHSLKCRDGKLDVIRVALGTHWLTREVNQVLTCCDRTHQRRLYSVQKNVSALWSFMWDYGNSALGSILLYCVHTPPRSYSLPPEPLSRPDNTAPTLDYHLQASPTSPSHCLETIAAVFPKDSTLMEEKHLMQTTPKPMPPMRRGPSSRLVRITAVAFFIGLYLLACYYIDPRGVFHKEPDFDEFEEELPKKSTPVKSQTLVPLEAHIMSKCPDARVRQRPKIRSLGAYLTQHRTAFGIWCFLRWCACMIRSILHCRSSGRTYSFLQL